MTPEQVIEILESYHSCQDAEADAMDFLEAAKWHASVAKWLREDGMKVIREAEVNAAREVTLDTLQSFNGRSYTGV